MEVNIFYYFMQILEQVLTHTSKHGAKTSVISSTGRRSRGISIVAATDTMFKNGNAHHVKMAEKTAAVIPHITVAGNPTTTTHPWYTPSLVLLYTRSRAAVIRGPVRVSLSCGNVLANPNYGSNMSVHQTQRDTLYV